jgi:Xaa-Pro dipeptidase
MAALGSSALKIGIDPLAMRVFEQQLLESQSESVSWEDGAALLGEMRIVKDAAEIQALKRAVELTEIVLKKTIDSIEPGQTELQIARKMQMLAFEHQTTMPFAPIVASGPNGGNPHAIPGDRVIQQGDLITFDVGAWLDGYPGDITRNVALGQIDPKLEEIHELVKQANEAGRSAAGPDVTCQDVDRAARKVIEDGGYGDYFIHRTGHGLGLEIHEPPYIVEGNTLPLAPGHVFTVEPGVYIPDLGGVRVEDDCVVTKDGMESLTTFPRELIKL